MVKSTDEELSEGYNQLVGVRIWFSFQIAFCIIAIIYGVYNLYLTGIIIALIFLAMLIIALFGIKDRRPYSVPLSRAILILTMLGIPIGTIVGVIL